MPQTEEIRSAWNQMAATFETWVEPSSVLIAQSLMGLLRLESATSFLEVGGGAGASAQRASQMLPPGARQVATDLSPEMVRRSQAKNPGIEVVEADAELLPFPDASFDRYLASLNLQIVADPDAALREAFRVLTPGGLAAWSVWGRRRKSPLMILQEKALKRAGIVVPEQRSNFHLRHRKALLRRMRRAGFRDFLVWRQPMLQSFEDGADFGRKIQQGGPRLQRMLEGVSDEQRQRFETEISRLAQRVLDRGTPIGLEVLMVVARKPSLIVEDTDPEVTAEAIFVDTELPQLEPDVPTVESEETTRFAEEPAGSGAGTTEDIVDEAGDEAEESL